MKKITLLSIFFTSIITAGFSQKSKADKYFKYQNFSFALDEYLELLEEDEDNLEYNYRAAVCYLNTNGDKSEAISYLEKVIAADNTNPDAVYLLGRAYQFGYKFEEAIKQFNIYKQLGKGSYYNLQDVDRQIEHCQNAMKLMKNPVDVSFFNLGEEINSSFDDYYPFVPRDESFVVFNSRRRDNSVQQDNGLFFTNTFISKVVDGDYQKASQTFDINDPKFDNEIVGMNADGTKIVFYENNYRGISDLKLADFSREGRASNVVKLGETINSKFTEISGALSEDGKKFFFASDREGGYGGTDLYMCQRLPNGEWSDAMNLGPTVNTVYDEDFPNLYDNGKVLYFSSRGHSSMGGYDIFKSTWNEQKREYTNVENLGYPINTPEDNMNFRLSDNGKFGYIAAVREEGLGGLDIYRVNFNDIESKYTVIRGEIICKSDKKPQNIFITVYDENGDVYGDYKPNMESMKYVIILPAGNYSMEVESPGYNLIEETIAVKDKVSYKPEVVSDIVLTKN